METVGNVGALICWNRVLGPIVSLYLYFGGHYNYCAYHKEPPPKKNITSQEIELVLIASPFVGTGQLRHALASFVDLLGICRRRPKSLRGTTGDLTDCKEIQKGSRITA